MTAVGIGKGWERQWSACATCWECIVRFHQKNKKMGSAPGTQWRIKTYWDRRVLFLGTDLQICIKTGATLSHLRAFSSRGDSFIRDVLVYKYHALKFCFAFASSRRRKSHAGHEEWNRARTHTRRRIPYRIWLICSGSCYDRMGASPWK